MGPRLLERREHESNNTVARFAHGRPSASWLDTIAPPLLRGGLEGGQARETHGMRRPPRFVRFRAQGRVAPLGALAWRAAFKRSRVTALNFASGVGRI